MSRTPTGTTLTLADLEDWGEPGTHLAVLGHPVRHSLSPAMHNAALSHLAKGDPQFGTWRYWRVEIAPDALHSALGILHRKGFAGVNLTLPHKLRAMALAIRVDPAAVAIGAVNTLRREANGFEGFNTDGYGLVEGLRESLGVELSGADVVLLGAGGAARAAAVACLERGCRTLWIGNRSPGPLDALLATLEPRAGATRLRRFSLQAPEGEFPRDALIVNATASGLKPDDPVVIGLDIFPGTPVVYDMIYKPAKTPLTKEASRLGLKFASGLSMLVHQGARSLELWTGVRPSTEVMHAAATEALG